MTSLYKHSPLPPPNQNSTPPPPQTKTPIPPCKNPPKEKKIKIFLCAKEEASKTSLVTGYA